LSRHYTDEEIEKAKSINMLLFLEDHLCMEFNVKGGEYVSRQHPSLSVNQDCKRWYWHSHNCGGGNAVDFLMYIEGMKFTDAIGFLLNGYTGYCEDHEKTVVRSGHNHDEQRCHLLSQPEKSSTYRRLFAYLIKTRHIDSEIVQSLVDDEKIYEDVRGNVVFCGYDENGVIRYATLRGTLSNSVKPFRHDAFGSDKRYAFRFGDDSGDTVFVFEAAIDAMSHATLALHNGGRWREQSRLALGGVTDTALDEYLRTHPHTKRIVICTDNDDTGNTAAEQMQEKYPKLGYTVERELPMNGKDFNEELTNKFDEQ